MTANVRSLGRDSANQHDGRATGDYLLKRPSARAAQDRPDEGCDAVTGFARDGSGQVELIDRRKTPLVRSSVEKYVNSIFPRVGLAEERLLSRRVAAVLAYVRAAST